MFSNKAIWSRGLRVLAKALVNYVTHLPQEPSILHAFCIPAVRARCTPPRLQPRPTVGGGRDRTMGEQRRQTWDRTIKLY